jgi:VanZ family protein
MTKFISGWRSKHVDWLVLAGLIGIMYGTLPYGPRIINSLYAGTGKEEFNSIVLFIGLFGVIVSLLYSSSLVGFSKGHIGRIMLAVGILAYLAWFITIPAERLHFIEYALLGVAIERVLRSYIQDVGRPFIGMSCAYFFGMGDETVQWFLSNRHGEIKDVFLNGWGGILGILLLPWPQETLTSGSHRLIFLLITIAIVLSILFTFATRDFGHMIVDEPKGFRFRSRLSPDDLRQYDLEHGKRFGGILKQDIRLPYAQFLKKYGANRFSFLHEMRVHIFRRDRYAKKGQAKASWIALRENQILESHFGRCLAEAGLDWPAHKVRRVESRSGGRDRQFYTSSVSNKVITTFSPLQFAVIGTGLLGISCILFLVTRRWPHVG